MTNRYEVTGRATVTLTSGQTETVTLDKEVVTVAASYQAARVAVMQAAGRNGISVDSITWFQPANVRELDGDQPALIGDETAPAANGVVELDPSPNVIRTDGGTQARAGVNPQKIDEYQERMRMGDTFPPITVYYDGEVYWLADGFHRLYAHRSEYRVNGNFTKKIAAEVKAGTRRDAVLHACGANSDHGLPRTKDDKVRAVTVLLEDEEWHKWSDREIARRCKVSHTFVAKLRENTNGHTGNVASMERTYIHPKTGQETTMNTAAIGQNRPVPRIMQVEADTPVKAEFVAPAAPEVVINAQVFNAVKQLRDMGYKVEATKGYEPLRWSINGGEWLETAAVWEFLDSVKPGAADHVLPAAEPTPAVEPSPDSDPGYVPIWKLELHVRQWLKSPDMAAMGHTDPLDNLVDIKEKRHGHGVAWNNLKWGLDNDQVAYLVADLRQACNNVLDQLRQRQAAVTPPPPTPVPRPASTENALRAALHVHPTTGAKLERVFFHNGRPFVAVAMIYHGDGRQTYNAYELIEAGQYDGATGPLYQGLPVHYADHEYRLGNPRDFVLVAAPLDPLDVLAEKLAALDGDTRLELADVFATFAATLEHNPAAAEFVEAVVGLLAGEEEEE